MNIDSGEQEDLDLYIKYKGDGLPYFIFLVDGKEVGRLRGLASKSDTAKILRDTLSKELLNK